MNREASVRIGDYFKTSFQIGVLHVDEMLHQEAWIIFKQMPSKNMSFVDCSIIACMKRENILDLLTFDKKDFQQLQGYYQFQFFI